MKKKIRKPEENRQKNHRSKETKKNLGNQKKKRENLKKKQENQLKSETSNGPARVGEQRRKEGAPQQKIVTASGD
jgi:hypothetical protein